MDIRRFRDSYYLVYSDGRVYSEKSGRFLGVTDNNGYKVYTLSFGVKGARYKKKILAHRVIAEVFLDAVEGKYHVNHKNGIKADNRVENLEWCTRQENMNHAVEIGLISNGNVGGPAPRYGKLDSFKIFDLYKSGVKRKDIAALYGCNRYCIYNVIKRVKSGYFNRVPDLSAE